MIAPFRFGAPSFPRMNRCLAAVINPLMPAELTPPFIRLDNRRGRPKSRQGPLVLSAALDETEAELGSIQAETPLGAVPCAT
jgi:hypothetical protein